MTNYEISTDDLYAYYTEVSADTGDSQQDYINCILEAVFSEMNKDNPNWKNIKECIELLKERNPSFIEYIEQEYLQKQKELQKIEPNDVE